MKIIYLIIIKLLNKIYARLKWLIWKPSDILIQRSCSEQI